MFIETVRGQTYLVCRSNDFSTPRMVTNRWPLAWAEGPLEDGPAAKVMDGVWTDSRGTRFNVGNAGPPEVTDVPKPAGRYRNKQVRYRSGQWEYQRTSGRWEVCI